MLIISPKIHNISQIDRKIPDKSEVGFTSCQMPDSLHTTQQFIIINKNIIFRISFSVAFYLLYFSLYHKQIILSHL